MKSNAKGVKVVFSAGKDARKQTLYYFSTDLSDSGLKASGFLAFCDKLGMGDSFVKSASYLMHGGNFVTVRKFLLENSALILQDNSGVPLGYFDPKKWQFPAARPLSRPDRDFPGTYQPQMAELFRKGNPFRSISASAIAGARMNPTCCWRPELPSPNLSRSLKPANQSQARSQA